MIDLARRSPLSILAVALVAAIGPAFASAQGLGDPGATIPSDPVFTALRTDGSTESGRLKQIGTDSGAVLVAGPGQERAIPLDRLVKLTRDGATLARERGGKLILFPDGDRLVPSVIGGIGTTSLDVQSGVLGGLAIPADRLLGLVFALAPDKAGAEAIVAQVRDEPRSSESLWISNGDRLSGGLLALDEKRISFLPATGKVDLDRSAVVALGFDPSLVNYPRPEGIYLELTFVDGSRLGVSGAKIERGMVVARSRFGAEFRLPIAELAEAHVLGGPVAYLSDREATGSQYVSFIGPTRPYRRNHNVAGHLIRLGGRTYDRGLGTQGRTLLAYRLDPEDKRFQATVGLDDSAGPLGSVAFKVLLDGTDKVLYESPTMSSGEAPRPIDVDISGGRLLILITEFGDRGNVQDLADWAEARVIR